MKTIIAAKVNRSKVCSNKEFGDKPNGYVKIFSIPCRLLPKMLCVFNS